MPDTTNRPTPLEVVADAPAGRYWDEESPGAILGALAEHGYVIVHPDDVPTGVEQYAERAGDKLVTAHWQSKIGGWNACLAHIFGDDHE